MGALRLAELCRALQGCGDARGLPAATALLAETRPLVGAIAACVQQAFGTAAAPREAVAACA